MSFKVSPATAFVMLRAGPNDFDWLRFWSNLLVIKKTGKTKRLLFNGLFIFLISATYIFILPSLNGLLIPLFAPEHNSTILDNSLFFVLLVF